jgi:hypothetical protein
MRLVVRSVPWWACGERTGIAGARGMSRARRHVCPMHCTTDARHALWRVVTDQCRAVRGSACSVAGRRREQGACLSLRCRSSRHRAHLAQSEHDFALVTYSRVQKSSQIPRGFAKTRAAYHHANVRQADASSLTFSTVHSLVRRTLSIEGVLFCTC